MKVRIRIEEAAERMRVPREFLVLCIRQQWIIPAGEGELDEDDLARLQLIRELREDFGVNEDAIPIILHLLEQLYAMRRVADQARKHVA